MANKECIQGLLVGLVIAAGSQRALSETYEIKGSMTYELGNPDGQSFQQLPGMFRDFHVVVKDCTWNIKMWNPTPGLNGSILGWEHAWDGVYLYKVVRFDQKNPNANNATCIIEKCEVPRDGPGAHAWMALASSCVLDTAPRGLLLPITPMDNVTEHLQYLKWKASWQRSDSPPYLPTNVNYYDPGEWRVWDTNRNRLVVKLPKPYDSGFLSVKYEAKEFTNVAGLRFPLLATLELFQPKNNGKSTNEIYIGSRTTLRTTQVKLETSLGTVVPEVGGILYVGDRRVSGRHPLVDQLLYFTTNQSWLPEDDPMIEALFQENSIARELVQQDRRATRPRRSWVAATFALLFLVFPLAWLWLNKKRTRG